MQGQIIKLLGGFYTVKGVDGNRYETRARGNFRKRGLKPIVGDFVDFENDYILAIHNRKNSLMRPAVANISQVVIVMSMVSPDFSWNLLDRFLAFLEHKKIRSLIVITKLDLVSEGSSQKIQNDYGEVGYDVIVDPSELIKRLSGKITVFMGQTGVGKTTLLNKMAPEMDDLETGETSKKLGRGRHTTRHVELYEVANGLLADTPGFSSLDYEIDSQPELNRCFRDIYEWSVSCRFRECTHTHEPDCAVKEAVHANKIFQSRYDSYLQLLTEINKTRETYVKQRDKTRRE